MSTCVVGMLKLVRLVTLNASARNWRAFVSLKRKRRDRPVFKLNVPGPSKILRPELPYRNARSGTTGKAERSNHASGEGFAIAPFATRLGRAAPPVLISKLATFGVNGAPVYAVVVPETPETKR